MAGADPLAEDNDRNKPIDLVAPDDTVSRQTLKTAMADRERIMGEAREVRAKGFSTSFQRDLPLSVRSQSTLNVPLMAGALPGLAAGRYMSHTGIYQPPAAAASSFNHSAAALMMTQVGRFFVCRLSLMPRACSPGRNAPLVRFSDFRLRGYMHGGPADATATHCLLLH